ncbi:SCW11 Probable family 17 glucosidase SCW11 [Candida maltosa Xu316]
MIPQIISTLVLLQLINAAPLLLTRYHTAAPVTQVTTVTTGTTTIWLPPVDQVQPTEQAQQPPAETQAATTEAQPQPQPTTSVETQQAPPAETQPASTEQQPQPEPQPTTSSTEQPQQPTTSEQPQPQQPATSSTEQPQPQPTTSTTSEQQQQPTTSEQQQPATSSTQQQQQQTSSTTSQAPASSSSSGNIAAPSVIVYSPYANNGGCKTPDEIKSDITMIHGKGINQLRSYGTDCYSLSTVLETALSLGMTVNQGVWLSEAGVDSVDGQISDIISYGQANGWDVFNLITIGNEAINSNFCSVSDLIAKIASVKTQLRNAGYNGKVTTSEPPATFIKYPDLCTNSDIDIVGINPHSYFNANISPENSGSYIVQQQGQVAGLCGGKSVVITETGYPSQGSTLGLNVPTPENQQIAIASIIKETGGDCTILTTYNDFWKDPGPYGIEQYFGVINLFE